MYQGTIIEFESLFLRVPVKNKEPLKSRFEFFSILSILIFYDIIKAVSDDTYSRILARPNRKVREYLY